jgi:broad specificity phosphatase PhoE
MTEPFCPATLLLTRSAETAADRGLSMPGRAEARRLAEALRPRRVALVYCSPAVRAVQTAEIAAGVLGCPVRVRAELADVHTDVHRSDQGWLAAARQRWYAGDLRAAAGDGERGADVLARVRSVLEQIADEHRGETVLIVGHGLALSLAVARLARNLAPQAWLVDGPAGALAMPAGADPAMLTEVVADAQGLLAVSWGGHPVAP